MLANIRPGRTVRLYLSPAQKQATADRDGQIARRVIRALLQARHEATTDTRIYSFPLTTHCFAAIARKLGTPVGITRARLIIRSLIDCGIITDGGGYRSRYKRWGDGGGHRVRLFKLGVRSTRPRSARCPKPAVVSGALVKGQMRLRWWQHPLFGMVDGLPPPDMRGGSRAAKRMRKWLSADERAEACRYAATAVRAGHNARGNTGPTRRAPEGQREAAQERTYPAVGYTTSPVLKVCRVPST